MFEKLVGKIVRLEGARGKIDVALVDDNKIRELNYRFRGKDRATDVLSFAYHEDKMLGDIIISREAARRNADRFGVNFRSELKRLVIHGALHILGYDHSKRMRNAEEAYQKF